MNTPDYALAIALAVPTAFLLAFAVSFLFTWRAPKGTHRWPRP